MSSATTFAKRHDVEDALATAQEVDELTVVVGEHRAGVREHEAAGGEIGA